MIDQYYTPKAIATNIFANLDKFESVADFAIGDGSLIKNLPFEPNRVIGIDINPTTIEALSKTHQKWDLHTGDFLSPTESTILWLADFRNKLDLIVLNPPFSCKGKKRIEVKINNKKFVSRIAIAFLIKAFDYLADHGQLIAILPLSTLKSEADTSAFVELSSTWDIEYGDKFGPSTFVGCAPSSIVVKFKKKTTNSPDNKVIQLRKNEISSLEIVRGTVTIPETHRSGKFPVLHTVNLKNHGVHTVTKFTDRQIKYVSGTYLCLPRVCKPLKDKIVIIRNQSFVLSDCVFAIKTSDNFSIDQLKQIIINNWNEFSSLYESTCAPYITTNQLQNFFKNHGFASNVCNGFHDKKETIIRTARYSEKLALSS